MFRFISLSTGTFFTLFLFLFSSCHAQDEEASTPPGLSLEELQKKSMALNGPDNTEPAANHFTTLVDFRYAAKKVTPAVVHIKSRYNIPAKSGKPRDGDKDFHGLPDPFKEFFKEDPFFRQFEFPETPQPRQAAASGVILTEDGYILTNNHVINEASEIEVVLNDRRSYLATLVGTDPQTDLALIKIDEKNLHYIVFGNSDSIEIGEWVVAVGNPFNLASTVTAGIVSAKARNINILRNEGALESFIQTDAAVNAGNSGGALVSLNGDLMGINTAIATPTGFYAGYAFAIPSNIARKIVDDLLKYGVAQRGYLGVIIRDVDAKLAKEMGLKDAGGVYVDSLEEEGAAKKSGIKEKDVIIRIDGIPVNTAPEIQEMVARKRPGDKMKLDFIRDGKEKELIIELKTKKGSSGIVQKEQKGTLQIIGIEVSELSTQEKKEFDVVNGVRVDKVTRGGIIDLMTGIRDGFIIIKVNSKSVYTVEDFIKAIEGGKGGGIMIEGKYPNDPTIYYYAFGMK